MSQSTLPPFVPVLDDRRAIVPGFDPLIQPVVPSQVLAPLCPAAIQLDFICAAFNCPIKWHVEPMFTESVSLDYVGRKDVIPAAVFFPLVQRTSGLHVIFTRRALHLYDHAGQISFPGGRVESCAGC